MDDKIIDSKMMGTTNHTKWHEKGERSLILQFSENRRINFYAENFGVGFRSNFRHPDLAGKWMT